MKKTKQPVKVIFDKLTELYLILMLSVFLLFPGFQGYVQLTSQKWLLYAVLSGGYLGLNALLRMELRALGHIKLQNPLIVWKNWGLPQKLMFLYWCVSGLSTIFSVDLLQAFFGSARLEGFLTITLYCWCFLLVSRLGRLASWMLWVFGSALSVNCAIALLQLDGRNPLSLYPEGMTYYDSGIQYEGQFLGTIGNTNLLSAVLCIAIPAFLTALIALKGKRRFLLLIPLALCMAVLLKAEVAGGYLGVCGSVLLMLPVVVKVKRRKKTLVLAVILVFLIGLLGVYFVGDHIGGVVQEAHDLMHGQWDNSYGSGRLFIWQAVWKLVPEQLLLGGGPDTLGLRSTAYFQHYDSNLDMMIRSKIDNAHNEYLNVLVNQGLPALLLYLSALIATAIFWVKKADHCPAVAICGSGVLGYCIQAFFGISSPISTPFMWLALGLMLSCDATMKEESE